MAKLSEVCPDMGDEHMFTYGGSIKNTIRPYPNPEFDSYMAKLQLGGVRRLRTEDRDEEQAANQIKEAIAHTVLIGWENMQDEETGAEVEYSPKKAFELFEDKRYYHYYKTVREEAAMMAEDAQARMEKALKN